MVLDPAKPPQETRSPRSSWQIDITAQADRLQTDLARVREDAGRPAVAAVQHHITNARDIAEGNHKRPNPVLDWISGLSVEAAWRELQRAQEDMLALQPSDELAGQAHYFDALAAQHPDPDLQKVTRAWVGGTSVDPPLAKAILAHAHIETNTAHQSIRRLRNRILVWSAMLTALVCSLWAGGVTTGEIIGLGAVGGLLSVVFAVKNADPDAAYTSSWPKASSRSPAERAILAVALLKGSGAATDTAHIDSYAAIFGFSQQGFTRLVDEKAQAHVEATSRGPVVPKKA